MVSRLGSKEKWDMMGGNTSWIDVATIRNIEKIYDFLNKSNRLCDKKGNAHRGYSYSQIAKELGLKPQQVQFACQKIAFKVNPFITIRAKRFQNKVREEVKLVRVLQ